MKRISYIALLGFCASFLTTCEKFDTKPLTKVETGTATPLATSVTVTAKIIDLSGEGNTDYGFCYANQNNPTISNEKLSLGKPKVGEFIGNVDGLIPNTQYYVRAYCQSGDGVVYGKAVTITTLNGISALTTTAVTNIAVTSAVSGGNITSDGGAAITARGVVWSTSQNPTVESNIGITSNGTGTGSFISNLTGLISNTTYYVRAYATNSLGTVYGNQQTFTTQEGIILTATPVTSITAISAVSGGNITSDGGAAVTARGVVWSTSQNPTVGTNNGVTNDGTGIGSFISNLTGLTANTTYYLRAYATNSMVTVYGDQQTFITLDGVIALTTTEVASITTTTAVSGGSITSDGGASITARGVVWSTVQNPTVESNLGITTNGTGTGSFISNLTNLQPGTSYYVRAYATNNVGTVYGNQQTITTLDGVIALTTAAVSGITSTEAVSGGIITSDGGAAVIARGVVWSTSQNPTITSNLGITSNGAGTGTFTSNLTGLTHATTYYVRAYATNSIGTAYGDQQTFTTLEALPVITTTSVTVITATTAISGGSITSDGGFSVTARGVVWSTSQNPTTASNLGITSNGTGTGVFTSDLTDLQPATVYYVRAYATNSVGTVYGNEQTFTTLNGQSVLTTASASSITSTSALSGGNITSDGGAAVTVRGVVWSTNQNPTTTGNLGITSDGTGIGTFTSSMTGLSPGTTYYVRAFATNTMSTVYGNQIEFITNDGLPQITTTDLTNISATEVTMGGNVTSDGGFSVTTRGVCWSTNQNPTIADSKTEDGSGTGAFTSTIAGLNANTTYYAKAYAVNMYGTVYGNEVVIKTSIKSIGDSYQGGIVGYIFQPGDPGYVSGETHGLIAAPSDQSTGIKWYNNVYKVTGATGIALGTGNANTNTIVSSQGSGSYAARICYDLVLGGYSDWYLPSQDELYKLYINRTAIGGFTTNYYWSSSEADSNYAIIVVFSNFIGGYSKEQTCFVRAVRSF